MSIGEVWSFVTNLIAPTKVHYLVLIVYFSSMGALITTGTVTQSSIMDLTSWVLFVLFLLGPLQSAASGGDSEQEIQGDENEE